MQSELMKRAQPELAKLEKKYAGKDSQEDQTRKAQEMMMIYQKYKINPVSVYYHLFKYLYYLLFMKQSTELLQYLKKSS